MSFTNHPPPPIDMYRTAMDRVVGSSAERLDRALVSFVDGVTKHKPTPAQLSELEAADLELQTAMVHRG
jgi:hypothetical protein